MIIKWHNFSAYSASSAVRFLYVIGFSKLGYLDAFVDNFPIVFEALLNTFSDLVAATEFRLYSIFNLQSTIINQLSRRDRLLSPWDCP